MTATVVFFMPQVRVFAIWLYNRDGSMDVCDEIVPPDKMVDVSSYDPSWSFFPPTYSCAITTADGYHASAMLRDFSAPVWSAVSAAVFAVSAVYIGYRVLQASARWRTAWWEDGRNIRQALRTKAFAGHGLRVVSSAKKSRALTSRPRGRVRSRSRRYRTLMFSILLLATATVVFFMPQVRVLATWAYNSDGLLGVCNEIIPLDKIKDLSGFTGKPSFFPPTYSCAISTTDGYHASAVVRDFSAPVWSAVSAAVFAVSAVYIGYRVFQAAARWRKKRQTPEER
ncbi:hypothetical protein NQ038_00145 [Brevibacterium sp. 50QC2O2]|uniref:hypothetical protein n=1 Tax=Brevibacterium sp. 50QC2O2 TaxID=2968459 RepID=UPI00211BB8CD|nr:hypothetical protein [Brevibacterium sp. 50QC2O2]MCQ9387073.1 hypothetical protein [Brevibacterium sp. 50QC2O2]